MDKIVPWDGEIPKLFEFDSVMFAAVLVVAFGLLFALTFQHLSVTNMRKPSSSPLFSYLKFAYVSFLKPHTSTSSSGQQGALESFYSTQASVYDATRKRLLRGREDMLSLVVAQLQMPQRKPAMDRKPVWYDIGGGTGYNIEVMDRLIGVEGFFEHVYLVDLSPSLCEVAQQRVNRFGWKNVTILCQDARALQTHSQSADLVTLSYSLSMIPDFYSVVDLLTNCLAPRGIIGICDFYVQSIVDITSRNYTGGTINRHVNWLGRMFWRTWFDADRVNLDAGRRDYVEYRFGTILSASERNYLLGGIPYYLFVGCRREADTSSVRFDAQQESLERINATLTESPYLSARDYRAKASNQVSSRSSISPRSKSYECAIVNLTSNLPLPAAFYQSHHWRIYYDDLLPKHQQFNQEYIYAFNWEDPTVDRELLNLTKDDVVLTITSAGDNILDYILESPARIHAVDLNPNQNHLLELKCAAFTALDYETCWSLFSEGKHVNFRELLIHKLSPHLSSHAFQFWLNHVSTFAPNSGGLYSTGGSRHAINLVRWLFKCCGLSSKVKTMCTVETLNEQKEIWYGSIRDVLLSWPLHWAIVSTEWWSWKAAGVPKEQRNLILDDYRDACLEVSNARPSTPKRNSSIDSTHSFGSSSSNRDLNLQSPTGRKKYSSGEAIWQYLVATLDPTINSTLLSNSNYFYHVCLQGRYSRKCHPRYLAPKSFNKLHKTSAFDGLRIHTDELMEVITRFSDESLSVAILMDSMDWFTPPSPKEVRFSNATSPYLDSKDGISFKQRRNQSKSRSTEGEKAALNQVLALYRVLKTGTGRVLLRSAAVRPWYIDVFEANGFKVKCVGRRTHGKCIDRVNMYASAWMCFKQHLSETSTSSVPSSPKSVLVSPGVRAARSEKRTRKLSTVAVMEEMMLPDAAMEDDSDDEVAVVSE